MQYPLITEYIEAIQYSESFESADLQALRPVLDANGRPMMTSGNFAVVFKMQNQQTGAEYALKCFTQDQEGRAEAYRQIMAELRYVDSPYFIDLEYIEEAVWAGDFDCAFPAVLMPWVDGEPLDQHIRRLVSEEPERLQLVAYKFSVMASWLVNQPFAHGDLKPDNILVRQDGSMVLVDYDGIYVPSMRGMTSREAGTPAFRHPNRVNMAFDEYIDDFALATINLSLYLIALKPSLLQTHGAKDRLLFSDDDYRNIAASRIIGEISQLSYDAQLQRLYALFLIALSDGSLQRCENRLMLLAPPQQEFVIERIKSKMQAVAPQMPEKKDLLFNLNGVQFKMVRVEGGEFMMGATAEQGDDARDNEKPAHKVSLDSYYIGETQVTQALWKAVMGNNPSNWKGDNLPVETISWNDCQEFIRKLNQLTGQTFALPTEAQWEFAARGGNRSRGYKYAGSNNLGEVAWFGDNSNSQTHPVVQTNPNELGLYDMSGNVLEWCNDWYDSNYYQSSLECNPQGPTSGGIRVLRGGSWYGNAWCCRVSRRGDCDPDFRDDSFGMRLSLSLQPSDLVFDVNGVQFKMKYVEGGEFMMGATAEQGDDAWDDEKPAHRVSLDSYYIGETQVTQALWKAVMGENPSRWKDDNLPVETISWNDCQEFIRKLNQLTGRTFALPTEAQWEFAARGGKLSKGYKYAGSDNLNEVAWFGYNSNSQTHPVAQKKPNELGLYDMSCNVWEWCNDWYDSNYYQSSSERNPQGPTSGGLRVLRGGGWSNVARFCRVSRRGLDYPGYCRSNDGMRLSLSCFDENSINETFLGHSVATF
ncbi:MAG: SUMF1/EgtB/PvdO family nonheme iron enzyme [Paludibacteraceae bacterium]|nr:SUMF1/EgtB/PvdO family nonheme iron enzyme [Paludibacteraceae bacterium]